MGDKTYERAFTEILERECLNYREEQKETLIDRISDTGRAIYFLHLGHVYLGQTGRNCKFQEELFRLEPQDVLSKLGVVPLAIEISGHLKTFKHIINSDGDPKTLKETIEAITTNLRKIQKIFPSFTQGISRNFLTECLEMATECSALIDTFISEGFSFGNNNKTIQELEIDILADVRRNLKTSIFEVLTFKGQILEYFGANGTAETLLEIRVDDFPSQEQAGQRFDPNLRENEKRYIQLADEIVTIWNNTELPDNWENDGSSPIFWTYLQRKFEETVVNLDAMAGEDTLGSNFSYVKGTNLLRIRWKSSEFINLLTVIKALNDPDNLKIPEITLDDEVAEEPTEVISEDTAPPEEKDSAAPIDPVIYAFRRYRYDECTVGS